MALVAFHEGAGPTPRARSGTARIVTLWRNSPADIKDTDAPCPPPPRSNAGHRADAPHASPAKLNGKPAHRHGTPDPAPDTATRTALYQLV
jgi:hypothetical protein